MPGRSIVLANNQIYHIFNRGIALQPVFKDKMDYKRFLNLISFYKHANTPIRYSKFLTLNLDRRFEIIEQMNLEKNNLVDIICFCLMPNHFHLLLKQVKDNGISIFIANLLNSYTKYFNTKRNINGSIFQGRFKAVRIETDEQLIHTVRYIHLNPYTGYLVKRISGIISYPYSTYKEYTKSDNSENINKDLVLSLFNNRMEKFKQFTEDQADYQRSLKNINHLCIDI